MTEFSKTKPTPEDKIIDARLQSLLAEALKAKNTGDLVKAASSYSQALELQAASPATDAGWVERYELLDQRANCYRLLIDPAKMIPDLEAMAQIAEKLGDVSRQVQVMLYQADLSVNQSKVDEGLQIGEKALQLSRQTGDKKRIADCLEPLGWVYSRLSNFSQARDCAEQALSIYQELEDLNGEANALCLLASLLPKLGQMVQAQTCAQRAIDIFRQTGKREGEVITLNVMGLNSADAARRRDYFEQAAVICEETGNRLLLMGRYNNLGVEYDELGLYSRAIEYERRSVDMARNNMAPLMLTYSLDSLARIYLDAGDYPQARQYYEEGLELAKVSGSPALLAFYNSGLGLLALKLGDPAQARQRFQECVKLCSEAALPEQAGALAWLGSACLALGDLPAARQYSGQAVAVLRGAENFSGEFPPQDIWWWRYRALTAKTLPDGGVVDAASEGNITFEAWDALDRARTAMLSRVASLSDEGLRRNYFNKKEINRQIIQEWFKHAASRGVTLALLFDQLAGKGDLPGQLKHMLEIGVRLNARRDAAELAHFIMDEVVELSGAERAVLFLLDDAGQRQVAAASLPRDAGEQAQAAVLQEIDPLLDEVTRKRAPVLKFAPEGAPVIEQRSILSVPLVAQGRLVGLIYTELSGNYGRFTPQDRDLLNVLANQAAVAVENAGWAATLEKRVAERTTELQSANSALSQRVNELAIINTIGQGLASKLGYQEIINLVGDKLCEVFKTQDLGIRLYDREHNLISFPYEIYHGQLLISEPEENTGITKHVLSTMETMVINHDMAQTMQAYGDHLLPGTEMEKSFLAIPVVVGNQPTGVIVMSDYDHEDAFSESDVRLMQTLASSLGVALENARLFQETRRLLAESQQWAAEMATINTVSQAMASELEMGSLIQLIGEQIRQIFKADIIYVALYDAQTGLINFPYGYGESFPLIQYGLGLTSKIIESQQPLLINRDLDQREREMGTQKVGVAAKSYLGVPIFAGKQAIGVISVQSTQEEGRFSEADMHLLSTLAANVGAAIHNARLYQETQRRANEMAVLAQVGREISTTLDLPTVLQSISTYAHDLLAADTSAVFMLQPDETTLLPIAAVGETAQAVMEFKLEMGYGIVGCIVQDGKADRVADTFHDPRAVHIAGTKPTEAGEKLMVAPLMLGQRTIGAMAVWRSNPQDEKFSELDLDFLVGLSQQAVVAIENARLFDEIRGQKQFSESLVQNSPVAIVTLDLQARVTSWNPAAEEMFGYSRAEALGRVLDDLITNAEIRGEAKQVYQQIIAGSSVHAITRRSRKDGTLVDVELLSVPVNVNAKENGRIAIYHDITELKRAKEAADAANAAKSAFLATMSHEIRTPMNGIIGMTSLLLNTQLNGEQREFTETIRDSSDNLLTIINDILDFSKIEAGKMELEEQPFDLRICLESALDLLRFKASEKGLELAYQMETDVPPSISGDVTRLRQIIINLLNNAVKFTETGEVVLTAAVDQAPQAGENSYLLHFAVRDTGMGIPPERVGRLFQAFSQVDATTSRRFGGTGLGLVICKRLSEMMGGAIWVESEPGKGATFHFTIRAQAAPEISKRSHRAGEQPQLRGKRLLVVDDNATNRRILVLQTQDWGMLARATGSPAEALDWMQRGDPFDIAILDQQMPGMDGLALASEIRKLRSEKELPLVLFSSLSSREATSETAGFAAHLLKPLKPSALFDMLITIIAEEGEKEIRPVTSALALDEEMGTRHPLRILLAEDNVVNQKLALRLLSQMGYRADLAANGLEVIQSLERQMYDVILMDVQMPEMDGLEASRHICARWMGEQRPHIIAMTANAMQGDRELCLEAGMDDYISKPIRVEELVAALNKAQPHRQRSET